MPHLTLPLLLGLALMFGIAGYCGEPALAQTYPSRPITLVVGLAPGSGQDVTARTVARRASELLGVQIVIENKPGAGTMTGSLSVAKAAPDGYTLLQNGLALSVNPSLYKHVPYDAAKDFVPISFLVNLPQIVVVHPSLGVTTLREFLGKYRNSDHLTYAHPGAGTMPHLAAEFFRVRSGINMRAVPYRGGAPALTDVIAGHVHLTVVAPQQKPYIDSGQVRALAVAAEARLETLPDIPTFAEAGLPMPEINAGGWLGILAPAGTPQDIVRRLNGAFNAALQDPGVRGELKAMGFIPRAMTPQEFTAFLREDIAKWPPIMAAAGIRAE
jgi:tripartite-type tricarboxylate transporter receptor subunit TctC